MTKTWQLQKGPLTTRWAREVSPETVHPEYPRPQMVRDAWQTLNGLWDYALRPVSDAQPGAYDGAILVPFPVESALSGVMASANDKKTVLRAGTYVTGMSAANSSAESCFGTSTSDVSADPPKVRRSMSHTTWSVTPWLAATRRAASSSTTWRCP